MIGLSLAGWDWRAVGLFLNLREPYITDLSPLMSLEPLEKVPGGGVGCGGGVGEAHFSVQLKPNPSLAIKGYSSQTGYPNMAKLQYFGAKVFPLLCGAFV